MSFLNASYISSVSLISYVTLAVAAWSEWSDWLVEYTFTDDFRAARADGCIVPGNAQSAFYPQQYWTLLRREIRFMSVFQRRVRKWRRAQSSAESRPCAYLGRAEEADFDGTFIAFKGLLLRWSGAPASDTFRRSADSIGYASLIVTHRNNGHTIYATVAPRVWPLWPWPWLTWPKHS